MSKFIFDSVETGINIRFYREQKGWSQEELAKKCGCESRVIDIYESGRNSLALVETITAIANALGVIPSWLISFKQEEK